ncbi:hypothetical protein MSIMFB_04452 [Mycobacterium simulans]|uniref:Uncharacterized protein n=1 Tax=Mycobacterium simulans TaxID=627089 RepID=A0A7Z7NBN8_9MYCO|nr:hypothetical protein [Mycobacterium simulans]SOJ56974.1 hypothetical protein MSIMFB_04452 [Mycobacterium simulans]
MATEGELKRWGQVLDQIVIPYDAKHSGVRMLVESGKALPNTQPWRVIGLAVIDPLVDAWEANPPTEGSQLWDWIEPAYSAARAMDRTSSDAGPVGDYMTLVREARDMVQQAKPEEITVDRVLKDLELDFKLAVLAARLGHNGIMQLIDTRIRASGRAATRDEPPGKRYIDLLTGQPADGPSYRTMSFSEIRAMADPGVITVEEAVAGDEHADQAPILKFFAAQWVTYMITQWDELYRPLLADLHGCTEDDIESELFLDLNTIRQAYVHNRGRATSKVVKKNRRLRWFTRGEEMIPKPADYDQLLQELEHELVVLAQPPTQAKPKLSKVNASIPTELVKRFEQAATVGGLGVAAALEDALTQWIERNS